MCLCNHFSASGADTKRCSNVQTAKYQRQDGKHSRAPQGVMVAPMHYPMQVFEHLHVTKDTGSYT